jgi:hypothetical protein
MKGIYMQVYMKHDHILARSLKAKAVPLSRVILRLDYMLAKHYLYAATHFRVKVYGPVRAASASGWPHLRSYSFRQQKLGLVQPEETPHTQLGPCAM